MKDYNVIDNYTGEVVYVAETYDKAEKWITDIATNENYGMYRTWCMHGRKYYDVGVKTYYIM